MQTVNKVTEQQVRAAYNKWLLGVGDRDDLFNRFRKLRSEYDRWSDVPFKP